MNRLTKATDTFYELFVWFALAITVASTVFHFAEGKSWGDSIWWSFVTAMTVGYGDISPVTLIGRVDAVLLMLVVPLFLVPILIVRMMSKVIVDNNQFTHEEQEEIKTLLRGLAKQK